MTSLFDTEPAISKSAFAAFWAEYPRKVAKIAAERAYNNALKRGTHEAIMELLSTHKLTQWMGRPSDKIPHPASWLNREDFSAQDISAMPDHPTANNQASRPASNGSGLTREARRVRSGDLGRPTFNGYGEQCELCHRDLYPDQITWIPCGENNKIPVCAKDAAALQTGVWKP